MQKSIFAVGIATLALAASTISADAASLSDTVRGRILLQVEQSGEAWYVEPDSDDRYFLGRPADAFAVMRDLGLGIAQPELETYLINGFPSRLAGKIMLAVDLNGEAYYVNPVDLQGYYLGRPADAFQVMRDLGLGISDQNLASVEVADSSRSTPEDYSAGSVAGETTSPETGTFDLTSAFHDNVTVTDHGTTVTIESDGLPTHETGTFPNSGNPNTISEQSISKTITKGPAKNADYTSSGGREFGIALNGILFEPLTGEYWNNDRDSDWNLEWSTNELGFDFNNAHVQPDGTYHYHGSPTSLLATMDGKSQALLGYAADGFPIYFENKSSSWRLKSGTRPSGPGGTYDGTYVQDYEYVEGLGDLDECNGTTGTTPEYPEGTYYYVISETFPMIGRCHYGTPHTSFDKAGGGAPGGVTQHGRPGSYPPPPQHGGY